MLVTACLDLETSDLSGDRGVVLCGVTLRSDEKKPRVRRTDHLNPGWKRGLRGDDREVVKAVVADLVGVDVVAAHNGARFDLPFLRTRLARWGLPPLPALKLVDPLSIAWRKLRLQSNSLGRIQDTFRIKDRKTPLDMSLWMEAVLNGDPKAMDAIVAHCVADVKVLDGVLDVVKPYVKVLDDRGSAL